ncbi:hypothetical protein [Sphingomonas endolithica]|uniref:hypothetical protein n=1 Tax=Sphingomonas endolithica TaxID=2972485 RepID=UPI0021AEF095|nr:hypothetical protein [Sphingomonas sp. ZFBP2030]
MSSVAGRAVAMGSAGMVLTLSIISGMLLMLASSLGKSAPSFGDLAQEFWPLGISIAFSSGSIWAAVRRLSGLALFAAIVGAVALAGFWSWVLR